MNNNKLMIDFLKNRGFLSDFTEGADNDSLSFKAYMGIDPTADSLHLGHLVGILALRWLQEFGLEVIVVVGGATGMIGDPSGKSTERSLLSYDTLIHNITGVKKCLQKFLGSDIQVFNNYDWFASYSFLEFLRDVGKYFRVGSMLSKESVKLRCASEEGISFTEFSYQILQAYDFLHLFEREGVNLQIGGSDQWGNITAGTDLIRRRIGKSAVGLTFNLLTKKDGKKFGKSDEGTIWLDEQKTPSYELYQYLYRTADVDMPVMLRLLTMLPEKEIISREAEAMQPDAKPNILQKLLASEVTRMVHGQEGLEKALEKTELLSPGKSAELSFANLKLLAASDHVTEFPEEQLGQMTIVDLMILVDGVSGKSEARRLVENGGVYLNNEKIADFRRIICLDDLLEGHFLLLGIGRKKKFLLQLKGGNT